MKRNRRKIIGVTVGSPLPKPNLMQNDPAKGDYVKGKEEFVEQLNAGGVSQEEIDVAVNAALAQAKASGEFDGEPGKDGQDGYTPVKGVDYFDGKDGSDGKDGQDGKPGADGKDGAPGKTPVRGEDYWTAEDKTEIVEEVLEQIPESGGSGGSAIIDVCELPTENINKNAFYRLLTGKIVYGGIIMDAYTVHCVDTLPEVGELVTNAEQTTVTGYYCVADNEAYGYVDDMFGAAFGVPAGWYPLSVFAEASGLDWGGIITDIDDGLHGDTERLLLKRDLYTYDNEWRQMVYSTAKAPKFDVSWDGDMTDRTAIDMSLLGYDPGMYFVKVSDEVFDADDVFGGMYLTSHDPFGKEIDIENVDFSTYPGAFTVADWAIVVYSEEELAFAMGLPSGFITNGVYFLLIEGMYHLSRLTTKKRITKIDAEYLDACSVDKVEEIVTNRIDMAIGNAIGGSY